MFEKVNIYHPDKVADRIGGAIVDLAYKKQMNPKIAGEVLIGHGECNIIIESSCEFTQKEISDIVYRIAEDCDIKVNLMTVPQDIHLATNQSREIKCGDNGIFKGVPVTMEEYELVKIAKNIQDIFNSDGKYILDGKKLIICQSNKIYEKTAKEILEPIYKDEYDVIINPLGEWTGGTTVDSGCTNRKLGSDMAQSVTGGGLHFKDLSKADVSINIYAWLKAQETRKPVEICCAIGDTIVDGKPYSEIVDIAKRFIKELGGFEKFAEWGLVRPVENPENYI